MKPIPLYGKYNEVGNVELCETHAAADFNSVFVQGTNEQFDTGSCQFLLTLSASGAVGKWRASNKNFAVNLQMSGSLDNTNNGYLNGIMKIPFWGQIQQHSFIGVYESSASGIKINSIKVIAKQSKKQSRNSTHKKAVISVLS